MSELAILGGPKFLDSYCDPIFHWPIVNDAMRQAQTDVLNDGNMSGTNITRKFEEKFAEWQGVKYALAHNSGTAALTSAMYGIGLGEGDELICPASTYWASCTSALSLGATVVFCDIDPTNLTIDPDSFEAHITPRTKAVMVVHAMGYPADMDRIMAIARKHGVKVIEDVSHAQGGHYKGRMLGTFGDVAGMSLMTGKSFAIGEGGIMVTNDYEVYRRAVRFGHYERIGEIFSWDEIKDTLNVPFGGVKFRMHQCSSAIGLIQLTKYDNEKAEIDRAMKYYWAGIQDIPGLTMIYPKDEGSDKAGWYSSRALYDAAAFDGVTNKTFCNALNAEIGGGYAPGMYFSLAHSSVFFDEPIYGGKQATAQRFLPPGVNARKLTGELPAANAVNGRVFGEAVFKHDDHSIIDLFIEAVRKVAKHHTELLPINDTSECMGYIGLTVDKK